MKTFLIIAGSVLGGFLFLGIALTILAIHLARVSDKASEEYYDRLDWEELKRQGELNQ